MVPVSEPTLTFTMEARFNGVSSTIAMLLPWSAIAPVADRFAARDDAPDRGEEEIRQVRRAVGGVDVTVRAEVASRSSCRSSRCSRCSPATCCGSTPPPRPA